MAKTCDFQICGQRHIKRWFLIAILNQGVSFLNAISKAAAIRDVSDCFLSQLLLKEAWTAVPECLYTCTLLLIFIFLKCYQTLVTCMIHDVDDKLLTLERDSDSKNACLSVPPDWTLEPIDVSLSGHISGCFSVVSRNPFLLRFISKTSNDSATGGSEKLWSSEAGCDIWLYVENNQLRQISQFLIFRPLHLSWHALT